MSEKPILSNPSVGGEDVYSALPTVYAVDVNDPDRAAGLGDYIKEGILRFWRKVQGSYRYLGAKRRTYAPEAGTTPQVISVYTGYEPFEMMPYAWLRDNALLVQSPNSGGVVSQWSDRSGNAHHAIQSVTSKKPTVVPNGLGGSYTVSFTGDDVLTIPGALPQPFFLAMNVKIGAAGVVRTVWHGTTSALYITTDNRLVLYSNLGVGIITAVLAVGWHSVFVSLNGAFSSIRVDGTTLATGNDGTAGISSAGLFIGADNSAASSLSNEVAEIFLLDRIPSPQEVRQLDSYFAANAGITTLLPSTAILKNGSQLAPAWTPAVWEGKIAAWFRADKITGKVHGNAISQWDDNSGMGRHAVQLTGANQPLYDTSLGYPAVKFDGLTDFLTFADATLNLTQPYTIAVALVPPAPIASAQYIISGDTNNVRVYIGATTGNMTMHASSPQSAVITAGIPRFAILSFDGAASFLDIAGVVATANAGANALVGPVGIGKPTTASSSYFGGLISEILILPFVLTADERRNLEGYFFWKYGMSSPTAPWTNAGPMQPYFDDPWTPDQLTPRVLDRFWNADTILGNNADPVSLWEDSGTVDAFGDATATLTERPLLKKPGAANGQQSVDFDGTNDTMNVNWFPSSLNETIMAVIKPDSVTGNHTILGGNATGGRAFRLSANKLMVTKNGTGDFNAGSVATVSVGSVDLAYVKIEPTQTTYGLNGNLETPLAHARTHFAPSGSRIGSSAGVEFFDGEIFALISCKALSTGARQLLEGSLAWKYGISSKLPATHPYRFARPSFTGKGAAEYAWTMEVRDALGGIDATAILGRDDETLAPDGTTAFSILSGANISFTMNPRVMYLWPRGTFTGNYTHDDDVDSSTIQARLSKRNEAGVYSMVAESSTIAGVVAGGSFSTTWANLGFPSLEWNGQYVLEWRATDTNGFVSDWHGASYFATDATPMRPISLSPGDGIAVTGYPLITFIAEDDDDAPGAAMSPLWPFTFANKVGTTGAANSQFNNPASMAEDGAGNILVVDSTNNNFQMFTPALAFLQRFGTVGAGDGQFNGVRSIAANPNPFSGFYEIWTTETTNARFQKFTRAATPGTLYAYNSKASVPNALDIAYDDNVAYIGASHLIYPYNLGLLSSTWSLAARNIIELAINPKRNWLYVLETVPSRISVFDLVTREELFSFGTLGTGSGELAGFGNGGNIEIDEATEMVYFLDESNKVVQTYDYLGTLLGVYRIPQGTGDGQFSSTAAVLLPSRDGNSLYIADAGLDRVQRLTVMTDAQVAALSVLNAEVMVSYPVNDAGSFTSSTEGATVPAVAGFTYTLALDPVEGSDAPGSLKLSITAAPASATTPVYIFPHAGKWPVVPDEPYAFDVALRSSTPLLRFYATVLWYDSLGAYISSTYGPIGVVEYVTAFGDTDFRPFHAEGKAPPNAVTAECRIIMYRTTTAAFSGPQYVWIDDAYFTGDARFLKNATHLGGGAWSWQPTATEMPANRTYKIRARGVDAVQKGPWSDEQIIQKVTGPTVAIDSPTSGQVFQSASPLILWRITSGEQWAFQVQIYDATTLALAYDSGWVQSAAARSFVVPPGYLEDNGTYFLRMGIDDGTIKVLV